MLTLNQLMSVPYLDHGRDLHGLDCWGLVRFVRHHFYRLPLMPCFGLVDPDDKSGMTRCFHKTVGGFSIGKAVEGAIACQFLGDTLVHVGVVVNEGGLKVLHTGRKLGRPRLMRLAEFERLAAITRYYSDGNFNRLPE